MRALHVFPLFGPGLPNGSEYYQYMLTKKLVEHGVTVDVFTTNSLRLRPTSAVSLDWKRDSDREVEHSDGINIYRFPVTFSIPPPIGHAFSRLLFRRWKKEEARYGTVLKGSARLVDHLCLRARARPPIYDWLVLLARGPHSIPLLARVVKSIKNYDMVLVGFMPFAFVWQIARIAEVFKKPLLVLPLFHPDDIYHHFRVYYRCFAKAAAILAETPYSLELFKRLFPHSKPVQVGAGVDENAFADPRISGERFRAKHGLTGKKVILFVGRKEPLKRYDLAVEAIDLIGDDRVKLLMIGSDVDRRVIASPNVVYLGHVPREDLLDAYDGCDVFVLPSEHESFGMVFLEAWMRKKPVIGNLLCKPVASLIQHGKDGYLCSSPVEIAERILFLLSNPSLARMLGEAGYQKAKERYTWDAIGRKAYELYLRICKGHAPFEDPALTPPRFTRESG